MLGTVLFSFLIRCILFIGGNNKEEAKMELDFFLEDRERMKLSVIRYIEIKKDKNIILTDLTSFIGISEVRIKKIIDELNYELTQFETNPKIINDGLIIRSINIDYSIVKRLRMEYFKKAPTFLLFKSFLEESMTVKEFSKQYYLALPTIYIRQRLIKSFLTTYGIKIKNGRLLGNEITLRNIIFSVYFEIYNGIELPFSKVIVQQINSLTKYLSFLFHLKLSKTETVKLDLLIGILLCRVKNEFYLSEEEDYFYFKKKNSAVDRVVEKISNLLFINETEKGINEVRYLLGFLKSIGVEDIPIQVKEIKFKDVDKTSRNISEKIYSELNIKEHRNKINFEKNLINVNRNHKIFDFILSSFNSDDQTTYFFEVYPNFSSAVAKALSIYKNDLCFGDETLVNQLFFEYMFLLINAYPLAEVPVYVCVDFSLGKSYTNFIQNQIKGFKNLNIILENRLTSQTNIFVSDSVIEALSIKQIIWKRPPTPLDWEMFGDAIIDVKNKSKRM